MYSINSDKTDETVEILQKANNNDSIASKKNDKIIKMLRKANNHISWNLNQKSGFSNIVKEMRKKKKKCIKQYKQK